MSDLRDVELGGELADPESQLLQGKGPCPIGVTVYPFLWTDSLDQAVGKLLGAGFGQFEIVAWPPHVEADDFDAERRRRLVRLLHGEGGRVVSVNTPSLDVNLACVDDGLRAASLKHYLGMVELANDLEAEFVIVVPGKRHQLLPAPEDLAIRLAAESLDRLASFAARLGVGIVLETVPLGMLMTMDEMSGFASAYSDRPVKVMFDAANAHMVEDEVAAFRTHVGEIAFVQLSDTTRAAWRHDAIGDGEVNFQALSKVAQEACLRVPTVLELTVSDPIDGFIRSLARLHADGWPMSDGA